MIPTNRDQFIQYCLRELGEPLFQVAVALEQADDRVDEALNLFYERHYHGTQESYIIHQITADDCAAGYWIAPPDVVAVTDLFLVNNNGAGIFSVEYQLQLENLFSTSAISNYGDLSYYYMTQANISLINRLFSPVRDYTFNPISHKVIIAGGMKNTDNVAGAFVVKTYRKIIGDAEEPNVDSNSIIENIWAIRWLQNYATALIKRQWGQNLLKLNNVQLLGGMTLNGQGIYDQAIIDIARLELELDATYQLPIDFMVG